MTRIRFAPPGLFGFSGDPLANLFDVMPEEAAEAALVAARETGVRDFDPAPHDDSGLSEHRLGNRPSVEALAAQEFTR